MKKEKAISVYRPISGNYIRTIIKQGKYSQLLKEEDAKGTRYEVLSTPNIIQRIFNAGITGEGNTIAKNLTLKKAKKFYDRNERIHARFQKLKRTI